MSSVAVDVEYCGRCGYVRKFEELAKEVTEGAPNANVTGTEGRQASFEVKVNGNLIHSKLATMAYPDFGDVVDIIKSVSDGERFRTAKQQPITDCSLM